MMFVFVDVLSVMLVIPSVHYWISSYFCALMLLVNSNNNNNNATIYKVP